MEKALFSFIRRRRRGEMMWIPQKARACGGVWAAEALEFEVGNSFDVEVLRASSSDALRMTSLAFSAGLRAAPSRCAPSGRVSARLVRTTPGA